jgi:nitroimidazol reductase NimA-like FMN-containing flavoprotein (pyridoxamine 5'-phosphate oxidase superfamily)
MPKDYSTLPFTHVRRQDREVRDEAWIRSFLHQAPFGVLATVYEGQPFVNSNLFVYDEAAHVIYMHTAHVGRTPANIMHSDRVCFSMSDMGRLLPAKEALEFSVEYSGVTVFGSAQIVSNQEEAEYGLQLLLDKYAPHLRPGRDYRPITLKELKRTAVYRIQIEQWSGKKKEEAPDFPGAFFYADPSVWRVQENRRASLVVSTDPNRLDLDLIHQFLAVDAYWSSGVNRHQIERYVKHSLCFGVYDAGAAKDRQVGFARVITDFTTFAYLADVFVVESYQGRGIGTWRLECILAHPELQSLRKWTLNTKDAHELYQKHRFKPDPYPEDHLIFRPGDPDW